MFSGAIKSYISSFVDFLSDNLLLLCIELFNTFDESLDCKIKVIGHQFRIPQYNNILS